MVLIESAVTIFSVALSGIGVLLALLTWGISPLQSDISDIKEELKSDISDIKEELKSDISDIKEELKSDISDIKEELQLINKKLDVAVVSLAGKVDRIDVDTSILLKDRLSKGR